MYVVSFFSRYHTITLGTDHLTCRGGAMGFFRSEFFFRTTRVRILFFLVGQSQNLTLGYMTKTLNQIFFFIRQNQNIFLATLGIRIFF
jgi:hypothetical protein